MRATLLWETASFAARQGEMSTARALSEEAVAIAREYDDPLVRARTLHGLAVIMMAQELPLAARDALEEALDLCRAMGRSGRAATELTNLAEIYVDEGDYRTARERATEALALARQLNSPYRMVYALLVLGRAAVGLGEAAPARNVLEEGLALAERTGARWVLSFFLNGLAEITVREQRFEEARVRFRDALTACLQINDWRSTADVLEGLAAVSIGEHLPNRALRLAGAAEALRERLGALQYHRLK